MLNRSHKPFLIFTFSVICLNSIAQKKVVERYSDMPVLSYSVTSLLSGNEDSINLWMRSFAIREIIHLDSIYKTDTIVNVNLNFQLSYLRAYCNFILGNYSAMYVPDDVVAKCSWIPVAYKKVGAVEFKAYEQAVRQSTPDFIHAYARFYDGLLYSISNKEKVVVTDYIFQRLQDSHTYYEELLKSLTKKNTEADTMLLHLVRQYARKKLDKELAAYFEIYITGMASKVFDRADTLRGSLLRERTWWNVLHYDITVKPDYTSKTIIGKNDIRYKVVEAVHPNTMQIDLQEPLEIDSARFNDRVKLKFRKDGNAWFISVPHQEIGSIQHLLIYYHGEVKKAVRPPWEGGWSWAKDSVGNPWMTVTCEGLGASVWFPCKDHLSDEPDLGASLSMIVPDTLMGIANGRMISSANNHDGTITFKWAVTNPINNYDIIPYIGKYSHFKGIYPGLKGNLDLDYWVLGYNQDRAEKYMPVEVTNMLKAFESWYGPYPFYEDGYKLIEGPGGAMEHQSAISYGIGTFRHGYINGFNLSGTPWGDKFDYMIVHESGHEWFGNSITSKDLADMWVHEGFTCFSETLYLDYWYGTAAGNEYNVGSRRLIKNRYPVIGFYGVNDQIDARNPDIYAKGASMLQTIRHSMGEEQFKIVLKELNKRYYHQTVTSGEVEKEISALAGFDYHQVFDQYLRNTSVPDFDYYFSADKTKIFFRYSNCIPGFNLPLTLSNDTCKIVLSPLTSWQSAPVTSAQSSLCDPKPIENMYYIRVKIDNRAD